MATMYAMYLLRHYLPQQGALKQNESFDLPLFGPNSKFIANLNGLILVNFLYLC